MNRRHLLTAAPAAGFAGLIAAGAVPVAAGDGRIAQMYREITRLNDFANDPARPDDEYEPAYQRMSAMVDEVIDIPARDLSEMMLKFMALTLNGAHGTGECPESDQLWAEARALVGA